MKGPLGAAPLALVASVALTMIAAAQSPAVAPQLRILSPGEDAYVTGPTLLRARVEPPESVTGLTFFVNGRQACALIQLPFECEWDAGPAIKEHQVRAVATLKDGTRLVQTVRTKSVGYTERVDVDVVQVTVTVSDAHGRFVRDIPIRSSDCSVPIALGQRRPRPFRARFDRIRRRHWEGRRWDNS